MKFQLKHSMLAIALANVFSVGAVHATNGYFAHGYSVKEKGLAGAGAALSQDAVANATNPAGMAFVGNRIDLGVALFSPSPRSYQVTGTPSGFPNTFGLAPEKTESLNDNFFIPSFGYNMELDSMSTFGVSAYGNGGMNTRYAPTAANANMGVFGAGTTGVDLRQLFINASYARKLEKDHAVGASLIFAYQTFQAQGVDAFAQFSSDPANLSGNRDSTSSGFGLKLGYQGEVNPGVRVGVSYQSKMDMSEFDEYRGLFAEQGDFDIPSTYTVGVAIDVGDNGTVVADIQKINYSDVASISNPLSNMLTGCMPSPPAGPGAGAGCLGAANGGGFGWDDMTIIKLGYQWTAADTDWRVGISQGDQPIPSSEVMFNILAPAVIETHLTFGLTRQMAKDQEFNFAFMYAPSSDVSGANPLEAPGQQTIQLEMSQYELQVGWSWKH